VAAGRTDSSLGERYRRIARPRGAKKAIVAVGRSILVIVWHLLSDPTARFYDLGAGFYDTRINADRTRRNHIRQLEALGYKATLEPPPNRHPSTRLDPAPLRCAGCCRAPTHRGFSDQGR
jgi:transposase